MSVIINKTKVNPQALKKRKRRQKLKEKRKKRRTTNGSISESQDGSITETNQDNVVNPFIVSNLEATTTIVNSTGPCGDDQTEKPKPEQNCHRAGVDAFMTAMCYAVYKSQLKTKRQDITELARNKLYLSGKNLPLQITKGNFGKCSLAHRTAQESIKLLGGIN